MTSSPTFNETAPSGISKRKEMKKQLQMTTKCLQTQYKLDVLGIGDKYQRQHFKKWKEVESDWEKGEQYFSTCQIRIHVKPQITQSGSTLPT